MTLTDPVTNVEEGRSLTVAVGRLASLVERYELDWSALCRVADLLAEAIHRARHLIHTAQRMNGTWPHRHVHEREVARLVRAAGDELARQRLAPQDAHTFIDALLMILHAQSLGVCSIREVKAHEGHT